MTQTKTRPGAALATARKNWARWAEAMADGGDPPPPLDILEAGAVLQLREPMPQLERDAEAVRQVRELEARSEGLRAKHDEPIAARGGVAAIRARIRELDAELRKLRSLIMPDYRMMNVGRLESEIGAIRKQHPLVFGTEQPEKGRRRAES
jgi:hypothetical protein